MALRPLRVFHRALSGAVLRGRRLLHSAAARPSPEEQRKEGEGEQRKEGEGEPPPALRFFADFAAEPADVHARLLAEAHRKHGVALDVPPQLPPDGHAVHYPADYRARVGEGGNEKEGKETKRRERGGKEGEGSLAFAFAYAPTHGPPPTATAGGAARGLSREEAEEGDGLRARFRCRVCGRAYRLKASAEAHAALLHGAAGGGLAGLVEALGAGPAVAPPPPSAAPLGPATRGKDAEKGAGEAPRSPPPGSPPARTRRCASVRAGPALPDDDLVERLLVEVWDAVGLARADVVKASPGEGAALGGPPASPAAFLPAAGAVEGLADRRAELAALYASRPAARATPEGAAPGVKKRDSPGLFAGSAFLPTRRGVVSMRKLSKRFPNPFAEGGGSSSGEADLLVEPEREPINPFISLEDGKRGTAAADARAARSRQRPFACPLCRREGDGDGAGPPAHRFRVLDALLDHVESAHADEGGTEALTEAEWESLRAIEHAVYGKPTTPNGEIAPGEGVDGRESSLTSTSADKAVAGDCGTTLEGPISAQLHGVGSSVNGTRAATGVEGSSESPAMVDGDPKTPPFPSLPGVPENRVSVHSRMAVEVVLLGIVRHIQYGVLPESLASGEGDAGYTQVLQIILGVDSPLPPTHAAYSEQYTKGADPQGASALSDGGGPMASEGSAIPQYGVKEEEELVVVRCLNTCDTLPLTLLQQQLHIGCRAYVEGVLKMNRHVDDISRRSHAYPYVRVVPPQGSIFVL